MMVCDYDASRLLLISQVEHSHVAGLLAAHWGNAEFAELRPYAPVVVAAGEHDMGWWEWEIQPTLNAEGHPIDYIGSIKNLGPGTWLGFMEHGTERVVEQDPYAGLLVLMHSEGLLTQCKGLLPYMPDYSADPLARASLARYETQRQRLVAELRASDQYRELATDEHLWTNYKLLEVFDEFAQFVCNRYPFNSTARRNGPNHQLGGAPVPVRPGVPDTVLTVDVQDERQAVVRPYPFDVNPLVIEFPARVVPRGPYASREAFLRQYYKAERITITYCLHAA
jgi:hypothetical protein